MTFFLHKASGLLASGQPWSFSMVTSGSVSEAAAETTWGGAIAAMYGTAGWASYLSAHVELTETSTSTASSSFKQTTITRTSHAVSGTNNTASVLPDHDAMVVTFRTATATKSSHGRWYLPGWTSDALVVNGTGLWLAAAVTETATVMGTFKASMATGGLSPLLLTRKATIGGLPADSTQLLTSAEVSNKVAVQTRRGDKIVPARTSITW